MAALFVKQIAKIFDFSAVAYAMTFVSNTNSYNYYFPISQVCMRLVFLKNNNFFAKLINSSIPILAKFIPQSLVCHSCTCTTGTFHQREKNDINPP